MRIHIYSLPHHKKPNNHDLLYNVMNNPPTKCLYYATSILHFKIEIVKTIIIIPFSNKFKPNLNSKQLQSNPFIIKN